LVTKKNLLLHGLFLPLKRQLKKQQPKKQLKSLPERNEMADTRLELTDEQLEDLVEKVTERVVKNLYTSVGETVVKRLFWAVGIIVVSLLVWLGGSGHIIK